MLCIYILPTVVYAKMMHTAIKNPELMIAIKDDQINHENAEDEEDEYTKNLPDNKKITIDDKVAAVSEGRKADMQYG